MGVNEARKFVVKVRDPAEIAAEKQAAQRSPGEVLAAQVPGIAGLVLIGMGLFVMVALRGSAASYWTTRGGAILIGLGIASLGYWAFSSNNRDYNF